MAIEIPNSGCVFVLYPLCPTSGRAVQNGALEVFSFLRVSGDGFPAVFVPPAALTQASRVVSGYEQLASLDRVKHILQCNRLGIWTHEFQILSAAIGAKHHPGMLLAPKHAVHTPHTMRTVS